MTVRAGVAGHRGYSGAELLRILSGHSSVEPILIEHRDAPPEGPRIRNATALPTIADSAQAAREARLDVAFLATPPEVSMNLAPALLDCGVRVVDLSGAFRLRTPECYERWYREPHTAPALLNEAIYGLPEFGRDAILAARLVANPGCYPTAASLAIRPLVKSGLVDLAAGLVCDAKSGVSGELGRKPSLKTSFCEVTDNFSAYSFFNHRHVPEVLQNTGLAESQFSFTAQLIPIHRGIRDHLLSYFSRRHNFTIHSCGVRIRLWRRTVYPFIRAGFHPDLRGVARTNFCDIAVHFDALTGRGVIVTAIDNLGKGAAGQAVQNMNLMFGLPETQALL